MRVNGRLLFAAAVLLGVVLMWAIGLRGCDGSSGFRSTSPGTHAAEEPHISGGLPPIESVPSPGVGTLTLEPHRSPVTLEGRKGETKVVRGRVLRAGVGQAVANATVSILTGTSSRPNWRIDSPELWKRLELAREEQGGYGASLEYRRLTSLRAWKPGYSDTTDSDGSFAIDLPLDFPLFRFEVEGKHVVYAKDAWFELGSAEVEEGVVLEVEPAGNLRVALRDLQGRPVAGGRIGVVRHPYAWDGPLARGETGEDGLFESFGLRPGVHRVVAAGPGCGPGVREPVEVQPGVTTRLEIELPPETFVAGRTEDENGEAVPDAIVRVMLEQVGRVGVLDPDLGRILGSAGLWETVTDGAGRFRVGSLPRRRVRVQAQKGGLLSPEEITRELPDEGGAEDVVLVFEQGHSVAGRVVDDEGIPVPGAAVSARTESGGPLPRGARRPRLSWSAGRTSTDGSFRLTGLAAGAVSVEAKKEGVGWMSKPRVQTGTENLELSLAAEAGVAGVVKEAASGAPVRRFNVQVSSALVPDIFGSGSSSWIEPERPFVSEDGSFVLEGLRPGRTAIVVRAEGFAEERHQIALESGRTVRGLEFSLGRSVTVRGVVVETGTGSPIPDAMIHEELRLEPGGTWTPTSRNATRTDADGRFELDSVRPGARLQVSHDSFVEVTTDPIAAAAGSTSEGLVITLSRGGAIEGYARGSDGSPLSPRT